MGKQSEKTMTIMLDPGHGGSQSGATVMAADGQLKMEKDLLLLD